MYLFNKLKEIMTEKKKIGAPVKEDPNKDYNPVVLGVLSEKTIGITQLSNGKFALVSVMYNPETKEAGKVEIKETMNGSNDAEYDFRDLVEDYLEEFNINNEKKGQKK